MSASTEPVLAPLRPSSPSVLSQRLPETNLPPPNETQIEAYREQDRFLPIANVARLMKKPLSPGSKVSKDAKELLQESVSEFISFLTSEANDKCVNENRKTINGEDIIWSLKTLGFERYHQCLTVYLAKYRMYQQNVRQERDEAGEDEEETTVAGSKRKGSSASEKGKKKRKTTQGDSQEGDEGGEVGKVEDVEMGDQ
ncbi:histone-fold-containing protein [Atractiella rhizophila]|nr:histone-fold-containing protein [Atractiella rhizophila]